MPGFWWSWITEPTGCTSGSGGAKLESSLLIMLREGIFARVIKSGGSEIDIRELDCKPLPYLRHHHISVTLFPQSFG